MQLRLRTKLTLIMTGLVLLVVAVLSAVFVAQLFEQVLQQTDKRTLEIANQVFEQARRALAEAAERGLRPASNNPADINDYVEKAFRMSEGLNAQLKAAKLDDFFKVRVDGNIIEAERLAGKPAPDTFLMAARLLGVEPQRAVVIEDAISGVQAGSNGHFGLVIGVARKGNVEELKRHGAHVVVDDLGKLVD